DDVHPEITPGKVLRLALGEDPDRATADDDGLCLGADGARIAAEQAVVFQERCERCRRCDVGDRDDFEIGTAVACCADDVAPDPSESIDADLDRHVASPVGIVSGSTVLTVSTLW